MKKSILLLAVAAAFSFSNAYALNNIATTTTPTKIVTLKKTSPLCLAIAKGDTEGVAKLLELGADVNEKSNGMLPVHYAARYNRVAIMKSLIKAGANTNKKCDKGYSVKKHAELSNATAILSLLETL